jgi:hypothetical protein
MNNICSIPKLGPFEFLEASNCDLFDEITSRLLLFSFCKKALKTILKVSLLHFEALR